MSLRIMEELLVLGIGMFFVYIVVCIRVLYRRCRGLVVFVCKG